MMDSGIWIWPSDTRAQQKTIELVASSPQLVRALTLLKKSKEGLSNAELDDQMDDNSNWITLWTMRQLTSLGFVEYGVDLFGGPARFHITDLGRTVLATITGQGIQQKPTTNVPAVARVTTPVGTKG